MSRIRDELLLVSAEERQRMLELPASPATHARLLEEHSHLDDVEHQSPADPADAGERLRVVAWNAERGRGPSASAAMLRATGADVLLLSELDCGMARTGQRHTARELARHLGCGYAYGIEFLELGLGDERERAHLAGQTNSMGYHGGAILTAAPLLRPTVVRLDREGRWFDGELGERRVGGRIALLATLMLGDQELALASVHLESHSNPELRASQLEGVLDSLDRYAPGLPAVIGGDMNTNSLGLIHAERDELAAALREDPMRFVNPVPHEPMFSLLDARGYEWRACNRLEESTQRTKSPSARGALRLDWIFCRGVAVSEPEVIAAVAPDSGDALSDHEAVAVTIAVGAAESALAP